VSTIIMAQCWPLQMSPTQKAVLISLADNANDEGVCWPSVARIAMRTCLSERAVQTAVRSLIDQRLLVINERAGRSSYYIVTPAGHAPPQDMHPRSSRTPTPAAPAPAPAGAAPAPAAPAPRTVINHQEPPVEPSKKVRAVLATRPDDVPEKVWDDFQTIRKARKAPLTDTALEGIEREAAKAGWTLEQALRESCERSWQGFKASWVADKQTPIRQPTRVNPQQARRDDWNAQLDRLREQPEGEQHAERDDSVVDVEARVVGD